jgi:hypothetical protein
MAAMVTFWLALERSPKFSWHWPVTGLLIGVGFLCKFTNALELVSILVVLALVPRLRREFKRPGLYLLILAFALCTLPPIVWNDQHAWITLAHLRSRGSLDRSLGLHPLELLGFLAMHFLVFSPFLFLGLAWAVVANWRRAHQHFKVLFLVWFGLPVFAFYFIMSINKQAAPNWDALAFLSFSVLAAAYWHERIATSPGWRRFAVVAVLVGVGLSLLPLGTDILRSVHIRIFRRDPADAGRGWKSATAAVEKLRTEFETKTGERLFLIADQRDRASELSFYLRDKRVEGPGHPPVYIVESQDFENQFSFWPRYDQLVEAPSNVPQAEGEVYTEEGGFNPFEGRSALYVQSSRTDELPHNIRAAFGSTEKVATIEVHRFGTKMREWKVFLCRNYRTLPL